jgi:tRNA (cmo5U34)-methyltransferase
MVQAVRRGFAPDADSYDRARQMWIKRARELKVGERDLNAALVRMKQDMPAAVGQQLAWLREAGFVEVSCSYRNLIFAVLSGTKPANVIG